MNQAVLWSGIEAVTAGALSLASAILLARLVGPEEFGVSAVAIAVHVPLWVACNGLFADALVQREEFGPRLIASAAWSGGLAGLVGLLVQAGAGAALAEWYDDPRLWWMNLLLAGPLPLVGVAGAAQGVLTRQRAYRALAARTLAGQGAGVAVGVALALTGAGAWAGVVQQTVTSTLGATILLTRAPPGPSGGWRWTDTRELLRVGLPLVASTLSQIVRYRVFVVVAGGFAGAAALGQMHMAFRLVDTARDVIFSALWRLFLPDLARFQRDRVAMLRRVDRLLLRSTLAVLPVCAAIIIGAHSVLSLLLGPGWSGAAAMARPLAALMALMTLTFPAGVALIALGQVRFTLYGNLVALAACVTGTLLVRPETGGQAVAIWCASQLLVVPYALWVNGRALGVGPLRTVRAGLLGGAAVAALTAAVSSI